jgi:hypothetical protein
MWTRRSRRILTLLLFAVLAGAAYWYLGTHHTPNGQRALATLDAASMRSLRDDFNRAAGQTRIIVLLSPT